MSAPSLRGAPTRASASRIAILIFLKNVGPLASRRADPRIRFADRYSYFSEECRPPRFAARRPAHPLCGSLFLFSEECRPPRFAARRPAHPLRGSLFLFSEECRPPRFAVRRPAHPLRGSLFLFSEECRPPRFAARRPAHPLRGSLFLFTEKRRCRGTDSGAAFMQSYCVWNQPTMACQAVLASSTNLEY